MKCNIPNHPSFANLREFLGSKELRPLSANTVLKRENDGAIGMYLFGNCILRWYANGDVWVCTCNVAPYKYRNVEEDVPNGITVTTKSRLMQFGPRGLIISNRKGIVEHTNVDQFKAESSCGIGDGILIPHTHHWGFALAC